MVYENGGDIGGTMRDGWEWIDGTIDWGEKLPRGLFNDCQKKK